MPNCCRSILQEFFDTFLRGDERTWSTCCTQYNSEPGCPPPNCFDSTGTRGFLYNWYSIGGNNGRDVGGIVNTNQINPNTGTPYPDERNQWRVPTESDFDQLITYLGGSSVAGGKMKTTGIVPANSNCGMWEPPNLAATNEKKWSGVPGGWRNSDGVFSGIGFFGAWWVSTESDPLTAKYYRIDHNQSSVLKSNINKDYGLSIRLVRPATSSELMLIDGTNSNSYLIPEYRVINGDNSVSVKIGSQIWTQNLIEGEFNDLVEITNIRKNNQWSTNSGVKCRYNNKYYDYWYYGYYSDCGSNMFFIP